MFKSILLYLTCLSHTVQLSQEVHVSMTLQHLSPVNESRNKDQVKMWTIQAMKNMH